MTTRRYGTERFAPLPDRTSGFAGLLPRMCPTPEGVVEHVVSEGETLQSLAYHYYNDTRLWFWILDANPQLECGADFRSTPGPDDSAGTSSPMVGATIVIPARQR